MHSVLLLLIAFSFSVDAQSCKKTIKKFKFKKILKACSTDSGQNILGCFLERVHGMGTETCQACIQEAIGREPREPAVCTQVWQEGYNRRNGRVS